MAKFFTVTEEKISPALNIDIYHNKMNFAVPNFIDVVFFVL